MKNLLIALFLLVPFAPLVTVQAGIIENGDFSQGRDHWSGEGEIIGLNDSGNPAIEGEAVVGHALQVKLHASDWTIIEQHLRPDDQKADFKELKFTFEVMALSDYAPLAESPAYTGSLPPGPGVNAVPVSEWRESRGSYRSGVAVFPKGDYVFRLTDQLFHYTPRKVVKDGTWKAVHLDLIYLRLNDHNLAFMFPPGTGTILVRNVAQE